MESPEQKFLELISKSHINISINTFPNDINIINSEGEWLILYNKKREYVDIKHSLVWSFFEIGYNMNQEKIRMFLKNMLKKHFDINKTPRWMNEVYHHN